MSSFVALEMNFLLIFANENLPKKIVSGFKVEEVFDVWGVDASGKLYFLIKGTFPSVLDLLVNEPDNYKLIETANRSS